MKTINKENYESYLLDYIEHTLDEKERKEVEAFLIEHPDLALLIDGLDEIKLSPIHIKYPHKKSLYQKNKGQLRYLWLPLSAAAALALFYILPGNSAQNTYQPRARFSEVNTADDLEKNPFLMYINEDKEVIKKQAVEKKYTQPAVNYASIDYMNKKIPQLIQNKLLDNSLLIVPETKLIATSQPTENDEYPSIKTALIKRVANKLKLKEDDNLNNLAFEFGAKTIQNISKGKIKLDRTANADGSKSVALTMAKLEIARTTKINL